MYIRKRCATLYNSEQMSCKVLHFVWSTIASARVETIALRSKTPVLIRSQRIPADCRPIKGEVFADDTRNFWITAAEGKTLRLEMEENLQWRGTGSSRVRSWARLPADGKPRCGRFSGTRYAFTDASRYNTNYTSKAAVNIAIPAPLNFSRLFRWRNI